MIRLENESIVVEVAPEVGGRIVSFVDRRSGYDFLWRNPRVALRREFAGAQYDPNFFGGIDELLPNDIPETVEGLELPDHGELWTSEFQVLKGSAGSLHMRADLPAVQFQVHRQVVLRGKDCVVNTRLINRGHSAMPFLWKLHAAIAIAPGDRIECPAERFVVADPAWSRRPEDGLWCGEIVPEFDDTTEFLYLHGLSDGWMRWRREGFLFEVLFDRNVFPFAWYFASYGGFDGHRVAILEPCTAMPISVNEAAERGTCSILGPSENLATTYSYRGIADED